MIDYREFFEDWYYPECVKKTNPKVNLSKVSQKLFEPNNLLYEEDEFKMIKPDNWITGLIKSVKVHEDQWNLLDIWLENSDEVYQECGGYRFDPPKVGSFVMMVYDHILYKGVERKMIIKISYL